MTRTAKPDRPAPRPLGSIRADEVLPAELYRERMGLSVKSWREQLRRGLRAVKVGKRQYIVGRHALQFFEQLANQEGRQ